MKALKIIGSIVFSIMFAVLMWGIISVSIEMEQERAHPPVQVQAPPQVNVPARALPPSEQVTPDGRTCAHVYPDTMKRFATCEEYWRAVDVADVVSKKWIEETAQKRAEYEKEAAEARRWAREHPQTYTWWSSSYWYSWYYRY
jgi:hypothetical protein